MSSVVVTRWNEGLTSPVLDIAQTPDSPLRVLAGPGTGKTFSMMRRVARLLHEGVDPGRILVCTFTRTAATDLKKALAGLGMDEAQRVKAFTIHSFCFKLLSQSAVMEITGRVPRPLLEYENVFLLEDLHSDRFGGIRDCGKRLKAFDAAWARLQSDDPGWPTDPIDADFHRELVSWLRFHEAMLIGELVPEALSYLRDNPESDARSAFDHVLVDEYQDLNRADQVAIDLVAESSSLTVIGDENQSIYAFRYAHPKGVTSFDITHPGTHDEQLVECRRCPKRVVEIANALISNNTSRINRPIRPFPSNANGEVYVTQWPKMQAEAKGIAEYIQQRTNAGDVEPGEILVLAPRREFGYYIRNALNKLGVPAHSFFHEQELEGNPRKTEESSAQEAFALLILRANPEDRVALRCWCGFGSNSLNTGAWSRLRQHCEEVGESPRRILGELAAGRLRIPYAKSLVERFKLLDRRLNHLDGLTGDDLVNALFPESQEWAKPLRSLAATHGGDDFDAVSLVEHLRVNITQPELPTDVDYVRVMSLHKSKGLTADMVVVVGCVDGLIPTIPDQGTTVEKARALEEQRRLFYVGLTRTRKILVLSSVTRLPRDIAYRMRARVTGGMKTHATAITSRFIRELGPTCPGARRGRDLLKETQQ